MPGHDTAYQGVLGPCPDTMLTGLKISVIFVQRRFTPPTQGSCDRLFGEVIPETAAESFRALPPRMRNVLPSYSRRACRSHEEKGTKQSLCVLLRTFTLRKRPELVLCFAGHYKVVKQRRLSL